MIHRIPKGWKNHFFTENYYVNPGSQKVWFNSACKLVSAGAPTVKSKSGFKPITCLRCIKYLNNRR